MQNSHALPDPFIPAMHQHLVQWPRRTSGKNQDGSKHFVLPDINASQAEKALWKLGDDGDRYHRAKIFRPLPNSVGNAVATIYKERYRTDNKKKDINTAKRRANEYITGIYNRHLSRKLTSLCSNPLIYKPNEMIVEDEYLDMTFGRAPELKSLNEKAKNRYEDHLYCLLENFDTVGLMPVKRQQEEEDARIIYHDDGEITLKLPQGDNHIADSRNLQQFWNRTDNELRDYSFDMVRIVYQFMMRLTNTGESWFSANQLIIRIYHLLCAIPNQMGIREKYQDIPFENFTHDHAEIGICRLLCEKWWLRKLRRVHRQKHEEVAIACGVVHSGTQCYVSNDTFRHYQKREEETKKVLADMVAFNEDTGAEVPLPNLIEKSVANPKIRRHELMTRMRGCEEYAKAHDHVGLFITVTAPSRYHATTTKKLFGKNTTIANPKYDGATPDQTNQYLNHVFALARSAMAKFGIKPYGFRVVEPHEDETPHQHYMLFCKEHQKKEVIQIFKLYGLKVDGNEAGAKKHRVTIVHIDPSKGSATGYIAKYISKNIDGYQTDGKEIDLDGYGNSAADAAKRITAWRKCWGIRAFQPFGQPPVTIWRELRKYTSDEHQEELQEGEEKKPSVKKCDDEIIEESRFWADTGKWDKFIESMGGVNISRNDRPLWLLKLDEPKQNRYKEAVPNKAIGVQSYTGKIVTSADTWSIHRKGETPEFNEGLRDLSALALEARSAEALSEAGTAHPRSTVNNCTDWAVEAHEWITDNWQKEGFNPQFEFPQPPNFEKLSKLIEEIPPDDQPIAELLLQQGINERMIKGYIKRLRSKMIVRLSGTLGYKLYTYPNGTQALTEVKLTDPGEDWFDDDVGELSMEDSIFRKNSGYSEVNGKIYIQEVL